MELIPHFRVVRFSPVPEYLEPVNVALLILDSRPRLVSDFRFEKLACVAPSFSAETLRVWLEAMAGEIQGVPVDEILVRLTTRTSQIQLGGQKFVGRDIAPDFEQHLIDLYLKKLRRPTEKSETHIKQVESLIQATIDEAHIVFGDLRKRVKPSSFLSSASLKKLSVPSVKFSRVLVAPKALVLMDGLNLAVASRTNLQHRASEISVGYFAFGDARREIEAIEKKEILRISMVFNRPAEIDKELEYYIRQIHREADLPVDASNATELNQFRGMLQKMSASL